MTARKISPKEFLKNRRPERFSDTVVTEAHILDRSVLEHHIATLNKRSQELAFEAFAKRICEKVVCPNLLEQTGPVAGGDGKVDTQTYPVAEDVRDLWYEGYGDSAGKERWGFAVGTHEGWKAKCRSDVKKIKDTGRGYVRAFCITNQYIKSNQRYDLEDALTKEFGIDVQIFDISWLLDETFKNNLESIAIETLSIAPTSTEITRFGPNDYQKTLQLEELNRTISNEIDPQNITVQQVDIFLNVAVLNKELDKPLLETQGLFDRAVKLAIKFGTPTQQYRAYYQYAWAAYWWFEDYSLFKENMISAFGILENDYTVTKWADITTLLSVHYGYIYGSNEETSNEIIELEAKTVERLKAIAADGARPSNALQAECHLEIIKLYKIKSREDANSVLNALHDIFKKAENLVGFPFYSFFDLLSAADILFDGLNEYEELIEYLTIQSTVRSGEVELSLLYLKRGANQLDNDNPFQAIKMVGRALTGLYKHESRKDIIIALQIISECYLRVGLPWAARGSKLLAASLITDKFWQTNELSAAQASTYFRLAWIELFLGRLSHAITWYRMALLINANLGEDVISEERQIQFDGYMGHCILSAGVEGIEKFRYLPDELDELGLFNARAMMLYTLGHEDKVADEYEINIDQEYIDYLLLFRDYDFGYVTPTIKSYSGKWAEIVSNVLGCTITVSFPLRSPLIELAESIAAVIEGFCATAIVDDVAPREHALNIDIIADDDDDIAIDHEVDDADSIMTFNVTCSSFTPDKLNIEGQQIIQDWFYKFVLEVYGTIFIPKDIEEHLDSLLGEDKAMARSVSFASSFSTLRNVLGDNANRDIMALTEGNERTEYPLVRKQSWDHEFPVSETPRSKEPKFGRGEPPKYLTDSESQSHANYKMQGLIKERLWNKAGWQGTGYFSADDGLPGMALLFTDMDAARKLFQDLCSQVGSIDSNNTIRVSIITNINNDDPNHYRVMITQNPSGSETESQIIVTPSRSNTMEPTTNVNLTNFLSAFKQAGRFHFNYGAMKNGYPMMPDNMDEFDITINKLIIKDAWEVGRHELERMAIRSSDSPLIPEGVDNAPVLEVLKFFSGDR